MPTSVPISMPTTLPSLTPTSVPIPVPTILPTFVPTMVPSIEPQGAWTPIILVPYSPGDHLKLLPTVEGFTTPSQPFTSINGSGIPEITLVLAFSRSLDDYPEAMEIANEITAAVETQKEPWTRYFNPEVQIINCNNTDAEDIYDPTLQGNVDEFGDPVRWVGGPNLQFQKMMRWMIENIPNGMVFMKEFDTVPQVDNHFGNLLAEIERNQPVYMLGR